MVTSNIDYEACGGWITYPSEPLPIVGRWYLVSNDPGNDDGTRGMYTGNYPGLAPFVNTEYHAIGMLHCYYKELSKFQLVCKFVSDIKLYVTLVCKYLRS